jgi:hypothetical protein
MELIQWCAGDKAKESEEYSNFTFHALMEFDEMDQQMLEGSDLLQEAREYTKEVFSGKNLNPSIRAAFNNNIDEYKKQLKDFVSRYIDEYSKGFKYENKK